MPSTPAFPVRETITHDTPLLRTSFTTVRPSFLALGIPNRGRLLSAAFGYNESNERFPEQEEQVGLGGSGGRQDKDEGAMDKAKGRMKEAAGSLTGDKDTKSKGRADQRRGNLKEKKGNLKDLLK
jgi:uncharacterized protein YjbJ (UPF0337 family)